MDPMKYTAHDSSEKIRLIHELDMAWNSGDIERILSFYSEDFTLSSPIVRARLGIADGTLRGKPAVRQWWQRCLAKYPDMKTELLNVIEETEANSFAYVFRLKYPGSNEKPVVSLFQMDAQNKVCRETFYAEAPQ